MAWAFFLSFFLFSLFLISCLLSSMEREPDDGARREDSERKEILMEAIEQLPVDQKNVIELSRFQGLKYEEISKITGRSVPAVKVRVYRAIKRL